MLVAAFCDARIRICLDDGGYFVEEFSGRQLVIAADAKQFPHTGKYLGCGEATDRFGLHSTVVLESLEHFLGNGDTTFLVHTDVACLAEEFQIGIVGQELKIIHTQKRSNIIGTDSVMCRLLDNSCEDEHLHSGHFQNTSQMTKLHSSLF